MKYLFLLFLLTTPSLAMAQSACTKMGCINGLTIKLTPDVIQGKGIYTLAIVSDMNEITCKGTLPLNPCDKGPTFHCNSRAVRITESGCALPPAQQSVREILLGGRPRRVMLGFSRNQKNFLIRTLNPVYRFVRPNGPSCEPQCVVSEVPLSLQLPQE